MLSFNLQTESRMGEYSFATEIKRHVRLAWIAFLAPMASLVLALRIKQPTPCGAADVKLFNLDSRRGKRKCSGADGKQGALACTRHIFHRVFDIPELLLHVSNIWNTGCGGSTVSKFTDQIGARDSPQKLCNAIPSASQKYFLKAKSVSHQDRYSVPRGVCPSPFFHFLPSEV